MFQSLVLSFPAILYHSMKFGSHGGGIESGIGHSQWEFRGFPQTRFKPIPLDKLAYTGQNADALRGFLLSKGGRSQ